MDLDAAVEDGELRRVVAYPFDPHVSILVRATRLLEEALHLRPASGAHTWACELRRLGKEGGGVRADSQAIELSCRTARDHARLLAAHHSAEHGEKQRRPRHDRHAPRARVPRDSALSFETPRRLFSAVELVWARSARGAPCCRPGRSSELAYTLRMSTSEFNLPSLNAGGALDVVLVAHPDGTLRSSPWHVVFEAVAPSSGAGLPVVRVQINGTYFDDAPCLHVAAAHEPATFAAAAGESSSSVPPTAFLTALSAARLLHEGRNELRFSVNDGGTGTSCVRAFLYLWRPGSRAVVFDIDGTVTLSDVAGHAANLLPGDASPTHAGVCEMACELVARGYALFFLTSRPLLGVSGIERTRRFLFEVATDSPSGFRMPHAPVLTTTHHDALGALFDELGGKSRSFKSSTLKQLRDVFVPPAAPSGSGGGGGSGGGLYAGFGNREKDALAYLSSGVPPERVFIIDPSSHLVGRAALLSADEMFAINAPTIVLPGERKAKASALSEALPTPPKWESYAGMLASGKIEALFPSRVGAAAYERSLDVLAPHHPPRLLRAAAGASSRKPTSGYTVSV